MIALVGGFFDFTVSCLTTNQFIVEYETFNVFLLLMNKMCGTWFTGTGI